MRHCPLLIHGDAEHRGFDLLLPREQLFSMRRLGVSFLGITELSLAAVI